jgi:arabinan endo-1,5-alpha-L-arabinosidase
MHVHGRARGRNRVLVLVAALLLGTTAVVHLAPPSQADEGRRAGRQARPVIAADVPDPTVVRWDGRYVAVGTGPFAPRFVSPAPAGPWRSAGRALAELPGWARRDTSIWASDLVPTKNGWLLYFSALVKGLGTDGRCIGVATASSPLGAFEPAPRPLICPSAAATPPASDPVDPGGAPTPAGVIDPDGYTAGNGRRYLTYRTQGLPATIRVVPLTRSGKRAVPGATGVPVLASTGVVENPVLVRRDSHWVLFTSEGYYGGCGYRTTYRISPSLGGLATAPRQDLLKRASTGLCGPGGADLVGRTLFFHSWTCPSAKPSCKGSRDYHRRAKFMAKRSLFAARLRWTPSGEPRIASYVVPTRNPGVVPASGGEILPQDPAAPPVPDEPGAPVEPGLLGVPGLLPGLPGVLGGLLGGLLGLP